jgi:hypothetical protein
MSVSIATPSLGSKEWVNHVFNTPPVRQLKGRSKPTQYHQAWVPVLNRFVGAQGRGEALALVALEYFTNLKIIKNFKEQPFKTTETEFGREIVPDYFAVQNSGRLLVIEVKTARFITNFVQCQLDSNRKKFNELGLNYLVWKDTSPFIKETRHHFLNMRRAVAENIPEVEKNELLQRVSSEKSIKLGHLYANDISLDTIYFLAWQGKIFFDITEPLTESSLISIGSLINLEQIFFDCNHPDAWWNDLQTY